VQDIRAGDQGVELLVETGLFVRRRLIIGPDDVEAILPAAYQIVVGASRQAAVSGGSREAETAGGIVRMSVDDTPRLGRAPREEAA
jgi:hypothetical protein